MKLSRILKKREFMIIILDLFMMILLIVNLNLIVFDWIFASETVQQLLREYLPSFYHFYNQNIHKDFAVIDLYFVTVFLLELGVRWIIAAVGKTYHRWFFFPFIHWYDVLGCVPVGSMRFLRILRVISILIRLQKLQIIDITKSYLFSVLVKYSNIVVEEISDRVVINMLEGVQEEIRRGNPLSERVVTEVIVPHKLRLVEWLSHRVRKVSGDAHEKYKADIRQYIDQRIARAVDQNREIHTVARIPVFGGIIAANLEKIISDIVFNVLNGVIEDLASGNNKMIIEDLTDITLETLVTAEEDKGLDDIVKNILLQALEMVKEQVKIQQWKVRDLEEREERTRQRLQQALD